MTSRMFGLSSVEGLFDCCRGQLLHRFIGDRDAQLFDIHKIATSLPR